MATFGFEQAVLCIVVGAIAAIIYSLRVLISLEKRIINLDKNIELLIKQQKTKKTKK